MLDLSRWFNPFAEVRTEDDALIVGRAGTIGAFLMALNSVFVALIAALKIGPDMARLQRDTAATLGHQTPAAREALSMIGPTMVYFFLAISVVFALAYAVLGVVQWRNPNRVIPLLIGLVALNDLLTTARGLLNGSAAAAFAHVGMPLWRYELSIAANLVCLLLFYNGVRGAYGLRKLRAAA